MYIALIFLHVLICIFLVLVVLLQSSKGAGLAGAFGGGGLGGGMGAVFGGRGAAPFLSKATTVLAIAFMVSCLVQLNMKGGGEKQRESIIQKEAREAYEGLPLISEEAPPTPGETPAETPAEIPVEGTESGSQPAVLPDTSQ